MPDDRRPAEVFPPAEYIKEELEARGMSQEKLLAQLRPDHVDAVVAVLEGKPMSGAAATALSYVFGTSDTLWRRLDAAWWEGLRVALEEAAEDARP